MYNQHNNPTSQVEKQNPSVDTSTEVSKPATVKRTKRQILQEKIEKAAEAKRIAQQKERDMLAELEAAENEEIIKLVRKAFAEGKDLGDINKGIKKILG